MGHIARACKSKAGRAARKSHKTFELQEDAVNRIDKREPPITLRPQINGKTIQMELDTGAAVSIISREAWEGIGSPKLSKPLALRSYTGHQVPNPGRCHAQVEVNDKKKMLQVAVVHNGTNLFGRDWLKHFRPNWTALVPVVRRIQEIEAGEALKDLLGRYQEIFKKELGHCKKMQASIDLKDDAKPKFQKARPLPFAMKQRVEAELERLQKAGVGREA